MDIFRNHQDYNYLIKNFVKKDAFCVRVYVMLSVGILLKNKYVLNYQSKRNAEIEIQILRCLRNVYGVREKLGDV